MNAGDVTTLTSLLTHLNPTLNLYFSSTTSHSQGIVSLSDKTLYSTDYSN